MDYDLPVPAGIVEFHGDVRYTDEYNTWGRDNDPGFVRDSVALVNGHIAFQNGSDRYDVRLLRGAT
ncbi:MAG: hypothetical protein U5Q16_17815 [Gammaproteobacteria bacterium]|nr:hypothetical protein [Gammaproteobacteria bacterium]